MLDHRAKPADYELFTTSLTFVPDSSPTVICYSLCPGWWGSAEKNKLFDKFTRTSDQRIRACIWGRPAGAGIRASKVCTRSATSAATRLKAKDAV